MTLPDPPDPVLGSRPVDAIALSCEKCGAALQAVEGVRFLTCGFCKSRLEIVRSPDSWRTKLVEELERKNADLARDLEAANLRLEIVDLDREWEEESREYVLRDEGGNLHRPTKTWGIFTAVFGVATGALWIYVVGRMRVPRGFPGGDGPPEGLPPFAYVGLLPMAFGLVMGFVMMRRAGAYERALARHAAGRGRLVARLRAAGG